MKQTLKLMIAILGIAGLGAWIGSGPVKGKTAENQTTNQDEAMVLDLNIHAQETFLEARADWLDTK